MNRYHAIRGLGGTQKVKTLQLADLKAQKPSGRGAKIVFATNVLIVFVDNGDDDDDDDDDGDDEDGDDDDGDGDDDDGGEVVISSWQPHPAPRSLFRGFSISDQIFLSKYFWSNIYEQIFLVNIFDQIFLIIMINDHRD